MMARLLTIRHAVAATPAALFMAAWALTASRLSTGSLLYFALAAFSAICCGLLAYLLYPRGREALAAWLAVAVMLTAGYAKFFWLALDPSGADMFFPAWVWPMFRREDLLLPVLGAQTVAFAVFCAATLVAFRIQPRLNSAAGEKSVRPVPAGLPRALLLGLLPAVALSALAVKTFSIGVLGVPTRPLPFRLSGAIFYLQTILLPVLMLSQIWLAEKSGRVGLARVGLALLFVWAGADAVVRGSRGSLMLAPLLTLFMAFCGGLKIRKWEALSIMAAVVAALLIAPLAVQYRVLRFQGAGLGETLLGLPDGLTTSLPILLHTGRFFFFRIPGAEMLFAMLGMQTAPLGAASAGVLFSPDGLPGYLTRNVMGVTYTMSFAPSFTGSGYLLWGWAGIALFSVAAAALAVFGWGALRRLNLRLLPVASTFFLLVFFWLLTEGLTPIVVKQAFSAAAACLLCEAALRLVCAQEGK